MSKHVLNSIFLSGFLAACMGLSACTTPKLPPATDAEPTSAVAESQKDALSKIAKEAEARGDFQAAAREYSRLAETANPPLRQDYLLEAAAVLVRGNYIAEAKRIIAGLQPDTLPPALHLRHRLIGARIALIEHSPQLALDQLGEQPGPNTEAAQFIEFYRLRGEANTQLGATQQAVYDLLTLEAVIEDPETSRINQHNLWQMLALLPLDAIVEMKKTASSENESGWLELAELYKTFHLPTVQLDQEVHQWRLRHPRHPASDQLLESLLALQMDKTYRPNHIALLLPQSGPYEKPAEAIREGFFAAYYSVEGTGFEPIVRIYDTGELAAQTLLAYERAVDDGAEIVVGPLSKEGVTLLANKEHLPVPTLALNYGTASAGTPKKLYQFGLAPEDEAQQVAERAWLDGYNQGIVIVPEGDWGARVHAAFKETWEQFGGRIMESQTYTRTTNDFSDPLTKLLNIDESQARISSLKQTLGINFKSEPRRRQDIDFIFVAALPHQARQIRPHLKFFYAADLPVYATSHVFTGTKDNEADRDMDDIVFCDMPWTLVDQSEKQNLWDVIVKQRHSAAKPLKRLYALGVDSFNIIPHLRRLGAYQFQQFEGETGVLRLDENNRVHRQLLWARFSLGEPKLLEPGSLF